MIRNKKRLIVVWVLGTATIAVAQEKLPKTLEGNWDHITRSSKGHSSGRLSVTIEKQSADGAIEGRITFSGRRSCELTDVPMRGKFDGTLLTLRFTPSGDAAEGGCGKNRFVFNRGPDGTFGGEISVGHQQKVNMTLAPH